MDPSTPVPPRCVAAVLLASPDPSGLARFYRDALGIPMRAMRVPGLPEHHAADVGHVYVSIWRAGEAGMPAGAGGGLALCVGDVAAAFARLEALGVRVVFPPRATVLGVVARLLDPDGNVLELYQPPARRPG